jgi:predicted ATPase/DNA-binding CsgD family transcriptional regulator/DNA-binding XRE family transcriptional regulator/predicted negative regulator of RcsB-dependent stress response
VAYSGYVDGEAPDADVASAAQRLRQLRTSLDLSQEQLAHRLGVSFATVNRWEAGRTRMSARAERALAEFEARSIPLSPVPVPVPHSSFVGRESELADLSMLLQGRSPLISITGPGGVGKTRLALEAIRRFADPDETVIIPLEPVRHPLSLTSTVASCLRLRDQPGVEVLSSVEAALAVTPRLVVFDGAEHLRDDVAALVSLLLTGVRGVRIMVTSRTVLGVPGELCWPVPPMACPSSAAPVTDIASSDAVRLFMARAEERLPGFAAGNVAPRVIAELCRRLDCLPLAIELIAGWVGTLSLREIVEQGAALLSAEPGGGTDRSDSTLVDVVRRSYDLLSPEQRRLLPALSVFAGPFTMADAAAVSGSEGPTLAHAVRGLVDSSWLLVDRGEPNRFSMLATMRVFAAARLDERDEGPAIRRRHAEHLAALAADSEQGLAGPGSVSWAARLAAADTDLDVALEWAAGSDPDLGLRMGAALWRWWLTSGRLAAGRGWLGRFLAHTTRRDENSGRAFCSAAVLAAENGDYSEAVRLARTALGIFDALGLRERSAFAATVLGSAHRYLGDRDAAARCFQTAMDLRAELGDRRGMSVAMNNLALMALDEGDLAKARDNLKRSLVIKRQLGDQNSLAIGLANLSDVLIRSGELDAARRALDEATELAGGLGNPQVTGLLEANRGFLAAEQGRWAESAGHYRAATLAHEEADQAHDIVVALTGLGRAVHRLGRPDEAARHLRAAEALAAGIANPQRLADVRAALAEIGESADADALPDGLTVRQADVLGLVAGGLSNKQIAAELCLSQGTVERHLATVYRKLGLGGRVEAARYAVTHGLAAPARQGG